MSSAPEAFGEDGDVDVVVGGAEAAFDFAVGGFFEDEGDLAVFEMVEEVGDTFAFGVAEAVGGEVSAGHIGVGEIQGFMFFETAEDGAPKAQGIEGFIFEGGVGDGLEIAAVANEVAGGMHHFGRGGAIGKAVGIGDEAGEKRGGDFLVHRGLANFEEAVEYFGCRGGGRNDEVQVAEVFVGGVVIDVDDGGGMIFDQGFDTGIA